MIIINISHIFNEMKLHFKLNFYFDLKFLISLKIATHSQTNEKIL
jgi:hypothetical protein